MGFFGNIRRLQDKKRYNSGETDSRGGMPRSSRERRSRRREEDPFEW